MNSNSEHIDKKLKGNNDPIDRFIHGTIPWKKGREKVWKEINTRIDMETESQVQKIRIVWIRYAAAGIVLFLLGISSFIRFYTETCTTYAGQQSEVLLPDGSKANLNASSSIKYLPYWWGVSRKVELEGEAFFMVKEGKEFGIISDLGKTIVIGTSLNILSVDDIYEVTCVTGKVKVIAISTGDEAVITQNQKALLGNSGLLAIDYKTNVLETTAWLRGEFYFTSVPLEDVFRKIESSYGITIGYVQKESLIYTGYFKKDKKVENILNVVCLPFGMKFEEVSDRVYRISQNE